MGHMWTFVRFPTPSLTAHEQRRWPTTTKKGLKRRWRVCWAKGMSFLLLFDNLLTTSYSATTSSPQWHNGHTTYWWRRHIIATTITPKTKAAAGDRDARCLEPQVCFLLVFIPFYFTNVFLEVHLGQTITVIATIPTMSTHYRHHGPPSHQKAKAAAGARDVLHLKPLVCFLLVFISFYFTNFF